MTQKGSGWALVEDKDEQTVLLAGPFLTKDEAEQAQTRESLARLIQNRADVMRKYDDVYSEIHHYDTADVCRSLAAGLEMAVEIVRGGACPHCLGSGVGLRSAGRGRGASLICPVCGVDHTAYDMRDRRRSR